MQSFAQVKVSALLVGAGYPSVRTPRFALSVHPQVVSATTKKRIHVKSLESLRVSRENIEVRNHNILTRPRQLAHPCSPAALAARGLYPPATCLPAGTAGAPQGPAGGLRAMAEDHDVRVQKVRSCSVSSTPLPCPSHSHQSATQTAARKRLIVLTVCMPQSRGADGTAREHEPRPADYQ